MKIDQTSSAKPNAEGDATRPDQPGVRAGGGETILVVEDAAAVRVVAINMLKSLGYEVHAAEDGPSALRILESTPGIDLLFTDVVMPNGMSGLDLIRAARSLRKDLKVLITSGYSEHFIEGRADAEANLPLVRKPYRRQKLAEAVRRVLDGTS